MAYTFAVDPRTSDTVIKRGGSRLTITGAGEVVQRVRISLLHFWQEYFLNTEGGLPWYEFMLGSRNRKLIESLVRQKTLDVPGVLSIVSYEQVWQSSRAVRALDVYMKLEVVGASGSLIVDVIAAIGR